MCLRFCDCKSEAPSWCLQEIDIDSFDANMCVSVSELGNGEIARVCRVQQLTIVLMDRCPTRIIPVVECSSVLFKLVGENLLNRTGIEERWWWWWWWCELLDCPCMQSLASPDNFTAKSAHQFELPIVSLGKRFHR